MRNLAYHADTTGLWTAEVFLPWPPCTGNHMYGKRKFDGKRFLKKEVIDWQLHVRLCLVQADALPKPEPLTRCHLMAWMKAPHQRKWDLDNLAKPLKDALQACQVYEDDSQVLSENWLKAFAGEPGIQLRIAGDWK